VAPAVARRLADVRGVVAVVLGGSWARGAATPTSDVDPDIYDRRETRPDVAALRRLARDVAGPAALTVPYPAALGEALVRRYLYDARFMLALAEGPARRADVSTSPGVSSAAPPPSSRSCSR
jgi:hypothetical protein